MEIQLNNERLPQDYLCLKINSNDTYSRLFHSNNSCYSFTIEFEQAAAESLQCRINQCNRYQVISTYVPVRNSLGLLYSSPLNPQDQTNNTPMFASPIVSSFTPVGSSYAHNANYYIKSVLGKLSPSKYKIHLEELHSLRISLNCESFGESYYESVYENVYNKKIPPSLQTRSDGLVQQATLSYDIHTHLRNNCYLTQPYSIYPPFQSDTMSTFCAYP